jgi:hypothetical protein
MKREASLQRKLTGAIFSIVGDTPTPQIKMIVSQWYADEVGNQARIIKARD